MGTTTRLKFKDEARTLMLEGANIVADAVKVTLGAQGRTVVIQKQGNNYLTGKPLSPTSTKDGVTVANSIYLKDIFQNIGAQMIKEAAQKTVKVAGDGTTTSIVLTQRLLNDGVEAISNGANPIMLKKGIEIATAEAIQLLNTHALKCNGDLSKIEQIATIAANNDSAIGELIAETIKNVGEDAQIFVNESKLPTTYVESTKGYVLEDSGWIYEQFVTDKAKSAAILENVLVLLTDNIISNMDDLLPICEAIAKKNLDKSKNGDDKPYSLLIVATNIEGGAMGLLTTNKLNGALKVCPIRNVPIHAMQDGILEDLSVLTGATVVSQRKTMFLGKSFKPEWFGKCERVEITKSRTTFLGYGGTEEAINDRITNLYSQYQNTNSEIQKGQIKHRIGSLSKKMATIYVGGTTELERGEKKDRIDDAVLATQCAIQNGYVAGGGVALLRIAHDIYNRTEINPVQDVEKGIDILCRALCSPFEQILNNAGKSLEIEKISDKILSHENECVNNDYGYNCKTDTYENFFETGIVDAALVSISAVENASSIAKMFLTTEAVIIEEAV